MNEYIECDARTLVDQVSMMNIMAISGGRIIRRETGITLPIRYGYSGEIDLAGNDTYTVKRVYTKGLNRIIKGELAGVYCDEVGEVAYLASCYRQEMPQFVA